MPVAIAVAIITVIGSIIVAAIGLVPQFLPGVSAEVTLRVRVTDRDSVAAIPSAKVVLFPAGYVQYTDTNGNVTFSLTNNETKDARLFVESDQYAISDQSVRLAKATDLDVRLTRKGSDDHSVIVRVVDTSTGVPVNRAEVVFLVAGDKYQSPTDSNGLATFTITFPGATIDADITVNTNDYAIEHQQLTLRPETVQDIQLDRNTNTLQVTDFQPSAPISPAVPVSSGAKPIAYGDTLTDAITAPAQVNVYTFQANANDAILMRAGTKAEGYLNIILFGPDGKELSRDGCNCGTIELAANLPENGSYKIAIEFNGSATGEYGLSLQKTN